VKNSRMMFSLSLSPPSLSKYSVFTHFFRLNFGTELTLILFQSK
jgi:hypothetical protein